MLYGYKPNELPSSSTLKTLTAFRQEFDLLCRKYGVDMYLFKFDWVCPDTRRYYEPVAIKSEDVHMAMLIAEQLVVDVADWSETVNPCAAHDINDRTN